MSLSSLEETPRAMKKDIAVPLLVKAPFDFERGSPISKPIIGNSLAVPSAGMSTFSPQRAPSSERSTPLLVRQKFGADKTIQRYALLFLSAILLAAASSLLKTRLTSENVGLALWLKTVPSLIYFYIRLDVGAKRIPNHGFSKNFLFFFGIVSASSALASVVLLRFLAVGDLVAIFVLGKLLLVVSARWADNPRRQMILIAAPTIVFFGLLVARSLLDVFDWKTTVNLFCGVLLALCLSMLVGRTQMQAAHRIQVLVLQRYTSYFSFNIGLLAWAFGSDNLPPLFSLSHAVFILAGACQTGGSILAQKALREGDTRENLPFPILQTITALIADLFVLGQPHPWLLTLSCSIPLLVLVPLLASAQRG